MTRLLCITLVIVTLFSCRKEEVYPVQPSLTFKEMIKHTNDQGLDDSLTITVTFTDGDGDIGLQEGESDPPFNLFFQSYEKLDGVFKPSVELNYRVPFLVPEGRHKSLRGDISVNVSSLPSNVINDTLYYSIYLTDRAGNKSNVVSSPEVIITTTR
jgi:hypothetical protein